MHLHPCQAGEQPADGAGGLTAGLHFLHSRKIVHFDMVSQAYASSRLQCVHCVCLPRIKPQRHALVPEKLCLLPQMQGCLPEHSADQLHVWLQKSANVLLARGYTAKIADVGLAKILHHEFLSTMAAVGTFFWCAPEVSSLLPQKPIGSCSRGVTCSALFIKNDLRATSGHSRAHLRTACLE